MGGHVRYLGGRFGHVVGYFGLRSVYRSKGGDQGLPPGSQKRASRSKAALFAKAENAALIDLNEAIKGSLRAAKRGASRSKAALADKKVQK